MIWSRTGQSVSPWPRTGQSVSPILLMYLRWRHQYNVGWSWDLGRSKEESLGPSRGLAGSVRWGPEAAVSASTWAGSARKEGWTEESRVERQTTVLEGMFCTSGPVVGDILNFQLWEATLPTSLLLFILNLQPIELVFGPSSPIISSRDFPGGPVVKALPSRAGGVGLIPGQGTKIPHALCPKCRDVKQKQCCGKFNKGFKKWSTVKKKSSETNKKDPSSTHVRWLPSSPETSRGCTAARGGSIVRSLRLVSEGSPRSALLLLPTSL